VIGGPSGDDGDGGFTSPYSANVKIKTQVNEWSKDDHSINLKHKDVYHPSHDAPAVFGPPVVEGPQVPGMGPFEKRGAPSGGTAIGGPSGNDEGQSFDMPITGIFNTEVNDYNQDDHSIDVKNEHVHPAPVVAVHPPPHFNGPPRGGFHGPPGPPSAAFHTPPEAFEKRFHPQEGGTAIGGPGGGSHHSHGPEGYPHPHGATVIGGPSGNDGGISFSKPVTGHFNTNVNEFNKDDHSIDLKHKDEYLPAPGAPAFPPFGAPFKRGWGPEQGATVIGGPSGDDDGESFGAPTTIETNTGVNEHNEDDHSIHLKHKDVYPAPHVVHGPHFGGPGPVAFDIPPVPRGQHVPAQHGPPHGPPSHGPPFHGPHPDVYAPHTDIYAPHTYAPQEDLDLNSIKQVNNGPSAGGVGPFNRRSTEIPPAHFEHFPHPPPRPEVYAPYTGVYAPETYAPEEDFDLEAITQINNGPSAGAVGPFGRRAFSPSRQAGGGGGGTAIGGPSGDDGDAGFSQPTNVDVTTGVDEHNEDNHAIKGDFTHVHPPQNAPWGSYEAGPYQDESSAPAEYPVSESYPAPPSGPPADSYEAGPYQDESSPPSEDDSESPPSFSPQEDSAPPREDHEHDSQCSAQVHEVVRTVTKTQYKTAEATRLFYQSAPTMETSAVPMAYTPQQSAQVDPKVMSYAASAPAPASSDPYSYQYASSQRPMSHAASYSVIPVHVPMATPSSGAYSMATPSGTHGLNMPTDVSAEQKASPSSSAWASASHGAMFTGAAPRLSGGVVSAAAAVMGVLAFIL
jgi:hypothetical protein